MSVYQCPHCSGLAEVEQPASGQRVDCDSCGKPLEVPEETDQAIGTIPDSFSESDPVSSSGEHRSRSPSGSGSTHSTGDGSSSKYVPVLLSVIGLLILSSVGIGGFSFFGNIFGWGRYQFEEGTVSVKLPEEPTSKSSSRTMLGRDVDVNSVLAQQTDAECFMNYLDFPEGMIRGNVSINRRLRMAARGSLRTMNGNMTRHQFRNVQGVKTIQFQYSLDDWENKGKREGMGRILFIDQRLYQLFYQATPDRFTKKEAMKFLDSFQVTK